MASSESMSKPWTKTIDDPSQLITVPCHITGPRGRSSTAILVLDTGSTVTILGADIASSLDLLASHSSLRSRLLGPTGPQEGYTARAPILEVMGSSLQYYEFHCHDLEPGLQLDGVLGLDVLSQGQLILDFPEKLVSFTWKRPPPLTT